MKKGSVQFDILREMATEHFFRSFLSWNEIQGELKAKGYPNEYYEDGLLASERVAYGAIAERFILEDIDFNEWEWFEATSLNKGTDGESRAVCFVSSDVSQDWVMLGFLVTRQGHSWHASPYVDDFLGNEENSICKMNCIQDALDFPFLVAEGAFWGSDSSEAED